MSNNNTKKDVYAIVTDAIIALLEKAIIPWRMPWTQAGLPKNLVTKRAYRGINVHLLSSLGYAHNLFLTFEQLKNIGGSVLKGEKATPVVFTKIIEEPPKEGKTEVTKKFFLRYYWVFNIAQCKDIPESFLPKENVDNEPLFECQAIIAGMKDAPAIVHEKNEAFYHPALDYINMPELSSFESSESYYGTLFHELIHATGHQKRLNRKEITENPEFGSEMYSMEELTAEMGACYLKSCAGIPMDDLENNAAYIQNWLQVLQNDKKFVVLAASKSQQAVEYILKNSDDTEERLNELADMDESVA